jgi:ABC-type sugar transport system permease subunit
MTAVTKDTRPKAGRRWASMEAREARLAWTLVLPTAIIVFGLVLFPAIFSIWISFHRVGLDNLGSVFVAPFVGLDNYRQVVNDFAFKFQGWNQWGARSSLV